MVNDQLIRLYQLKQVLALERMSLKSNVDLGGDIIIEDPQQQQQQQQQVSLGSADNQTEQLQSSLNDSYQSPTTTEASPSKRNSSPNQVMRKVLMRKNSSNSNSSIGSKHSTKRRSSWRNLINPNYKSRSDEFHKIFCDTIPNNERLIADYSCALHREILIQGRVYISVNYIAFYSNLFTWITKLVIRLRNVSEIYKANTARIIPNALHIITTDGDKHVFASLVARDKSYVMLLRIWQNNIKNERMSDQEIRNLIHANYGKDLGMSDNEELKINSPDPITPVRLPVSPKQDLESPMLEEKEIVTSDSNVSDSRQTQLDGNNNTDENITTNPPNACTDRVASDLPRALSEPISSVKQIDDLLPSMPEMSLTRRDSFDLNTRVCRVNECDNVITEVVSKLNELPELYKVEDGTDSSTANSSTVVVDTPSPKPNQAPHLYDRDHNDMRDNCNASESLLIGDPKNRILSGSCSGDVTKVPSLDLNDCRHSNVQVFPVNDTDDKVAKPPPSNQSLHDGDDDCDEEYMKLLTQCECETHPGQLIIDEEFNMDVDDLFNLIFTNSKFMRTYMIQRGMTDTIISGWRRSNTTNGGEKSSSSTLSNDGQLDNPNNNGGCSPQLVRIKQVRQLNYSMSINHMWAKQVHIEERQSICQLRDGVYVLKSQTNNSGIPYGESFSVDLIYCLTRNGCLKKCRMLVHGCANFQKEKQSWKLAMVKPLIERQAVQGCIDFLSDLSVSIKDYLMKRKTLERNGLATSGSNAATGDLDNQQLGRKTPNFDKLADSADVTAQKNRTPATSRKNSLSRSGVNRRHHNHNHQYHQYSRHNSLVRAKSRLKERKLKSIYRYYIHDRDAANDNDDYDDDDDDGDGEDGDDNFDREQRESDDSCSGIDDSLTSFSDIDDTDSMLMMMHATTEEDPTSETEAATVGASPVRPARSLRGCNANQHDEYDLDGAEDENWIDELGNDDIMEKSFSDVDCSGREVKSDFAKRFGGDSSRRQGGRPTSSNQRHSAPATTRSSRNRKCAAGNGQHAAQVGSLSLLSKINFKSKPGNEMAGLFYRNRLIVGLIIVMILFFLIVPQVMILRRLDSLEAQLLSATLECDRRIILENSDQDRTLELG